MKKILLVTLCLFFSANMFSQIRIDKVEEDGSRYIITEHDNIYTKMTTAASLYLNYILMNSGDENYYITLCLNEGKMEFDKGRKLLLKFKDNSVMELVNCDEIGSTDYKYNVTRFGTDYLTYPTYNVTEEEIQKIIDGNVVKIRIENNIEYFDRDIKRNKFSKALKTAYDAINAQKNVKNDIYEGF